MLVRVWEYDVVETFERDFERVYGPAGEWARLFATSEGYLGTDLFVSVSRPRQYLTVDRFGSKASWLRFLAENRGAYDELDAQCARLTHREREVVATEVDVP